MLNQMLAGTEMKRNEQTAHKIQRLNVACTEVELGVAQQGSALEPGALSVEITDGWPRADAL